MDALQLEREFSIQVDKVKLDLGENQQFEFSCENSKWNSISTMPNTKAKPSTLIQKLEGENNWLKIQADLLLNMVGSTLDKKISMTNLHYYLADRNSPRGSFEFFGLN